MHLERAGIEAEKEKINNFEVAFQRILKFEKLTDRKKFRACIDLFEDTEYALISAFKFQLGYVGNKNFDFGEKNIRLYGILNAVYLQIYSIIELSKLLYYSSPKIIKSQFSALPIYKLRGIAGSHTVNFELDKDLLSKNKDVNRITSFRILQASLTRKGDRIVAIDENGISFKFDLIKELRKYVDLSTYHLINIIDHSIETLVKEKNDKLEFLQKKNEKILNMIDYNQIDENKKYFKEFEDRLNKIQK